MPKLNKYEDFNMYNCDAHCELLQVGDYVRPDYPFQVVPKYIGVIEHISQFNFKARVKWLNRKKARYVSFSKLVKITPEKLI